MQHLFQDKLKKVFDQRIFFFGLFITLVIGRLPTCLDLFTEWDEAIYAFISLKISEGQSLYSAYFDHKGPVLYWMLAPIFYVFGNSVFAFKVFGLLSVFLAAVILYRVSLNLMDRHYAMLPPLIFSHYFSSSEFGGVFNNSEQFILLITITVTYLLVGYNQRRGLMLLAGGVASLAFFIKPIAILLLLGCIVWIKSIKQLLNFIQGFIIGSILILLSIIATDNFSNFIETFIIFNLDYLQMTDSSLLSPLEYLLDKLKNDFFLSISIILNLFILKSIIRREKVTKFDYYILLTTIGTLVAIFLSQKNWPHLYLKIGIINSIAFARFIMLILGNEIIIAWYLRLTILLIFIFSPQWGNLAWFLQNYQKYENSTESLVKNKFSAHIKDSSVLILGSQYISLYFVANWNAWKPYFFWKHLSAPYDKILNSQKTLFYSKPPEYIILPKNLDWNSSDLISIQQWSSENYIEVSEESGLVLFKFST